MTARTDGRRAQVWCVTPSHSGGWGPVTELATLVARLWETEVTFVHPRKDYSRLTKALSMVPRVRGNRAPLLLIAAHPGDLLGLARREVIGGRFSLVGAWVIDSFWDERLPLFCRRGAILDKLWITDGELVDSYARRTGLSVGWAPWGADVLRLSTSVSERDIDVLRLGRQPKQWEEDAVNAERFATVGARYHGTFDGSTSDGLVNQAVVQGFLARSKAVLASGNRSSPADYTHPTREYITARFTEAAASGCLVVGDPPDCMATDLMPREALVRADVESPGDLVRCVSDRLAGWSPALASSIQRDALQTLDWRLRVDAISRDLGISTATLEREMSAWKGAASRDGRS